MRDCALARASTGVQARARRRGVLGGELHRDGEGSRAEARGGGELSQACGRVEEQLERWWLGSARGAGAG
jgi:hypothetical protein